MPPELKEVLDPIKQSVSDLMSGGQMIEKDAKNIVFHLGMADAIEKGQNPQDLYNSYPQPVKDYFEYTPADLRRQQLITIAGLVVSVVGLLGYVGFGLRAAYIAIRAWRAGAGLFEVAKLTAVPAILAVTFKNLVVNAQLAVNNLNDVFHWGPIFGQQNRKILEKPPVSIPSTWITNFGKFNDEQINGLLKHYQENGVVGINNPIARITYQLTKETLIKTLDDIIGQYNAEGYAPTPSEVIEDIGRFLIQKPGAAIVSKIVGKPAGSVAPATPEELARVQQSKTARPKLFLGTIFAGRVLDVPDFVRMVDDAITSEEDLVLDAQINMTRWLAAFPDWLNYKINIVLNPQDEFGVAKIGTWAVMDIFFNKGTSKGLQLDRIILGPMQPSVYWPEFTRLQSISFNIPSMVKAAELKPTMTPSGQFFSVDDKGNVITEFFTPSARPVGVMPPQAAKAPLPELAKEAKPTLAPPSETAGPSFPQPAPTPAAIPTPPPFFTAPTIPPQAPTTTPTAPPPAPSSATTFKPESIPEKTTGALYIVANEIESGLNLRSAPNISGGILGFIPNGTEVIFISDMGFADGFTWWNVRLPSTNQVGFMAAKYLKKK